MSYPVDGKVYEAAVKGRQDFRLALRELREAHLSEDVVRSALTGSIAGAGSYSELARMVGVSDEYVRGMALGLRPIRGKMLAFLGFERVTSYRRIRP